MYKDTDNSLEQFKRENEYLRQKLNYYERGMLPSNNLNNIPKGCRNCSNHPINGGSGICWCIIGMQTTT